MPRFEAAPLFNATVSSRYIGERKTVQSNPISTVDDFFIMDMNFGFNITSNFGLSLKIDNVFNTEYFHPGVRDANSGNEPGEWESGDTWNGSDGWYNSLMPQPGTIFYFALNYNR